MRIPALILILIFQLSFLILSVSRPISLAILLISSAIVCAIATGFIFSSWMFYFLMLVFLGGVIVVLIFITSVCTNTKLRLLNIKRGLILPLGLAWCLCPINMMLNNYSNLNFCLSIYSLEGLRILVFLILSLLLCIVRVVNVVKLEYGPLVFRL